jgi:hypothetical protein
MQGRSVQAPPLDTELPGLCTVSEVPNLAATCVFADTCEREEGGGGRGGGEDTVLRAWVLRGGIFGTASGGQVATRCNKVDYVCPSPAGDGAGRILIWRREIPPKREEIPLTREEIPPKRGDSVEERRYCRAGRVERRYRRDGLTEWSVSWVVCPMHHAHTPRSGILYRVHTRAAARRKRSVKCNGKGNNKKNGQNKRGPEILNPKP